MARFKVKIGIHIQDGQKYMAGQIVESFDDLTRLFPQKFERVGGEEVPPAMPSTAAAPAVPVVPATPLPTAPSAETQAPPLESGAVVQAPVEKVPASKPKAAKAKAAKTKPPFGSDED